MHTSTSAQTLPCRAEWDLPVWAKRIGIAVFAVTVTALESWLPLPIQHLLDGYLQSSMLRILAAIASVFQRRSL